MQKDHYLYLDLAKVLAIFLVIVNHTNSQIFLSLSPSITWFSSLTYFYLCRVAVPVFIMATGAVLLSRVEPYSVHAKRIGRMMVVLVVFSMFYLYVNNAFPTTFSDGLQTIKTLTGKPASNALWYLYLYIGILFALPFLQRLIKALDKRDIEMLLIISLLLFGFLYSLTHGLGVQAYAKIELTFFAYPVGYLCAGYYVQKYVPSSSALVAIAIAAFIISVTFAVLISWSQFDLGYGRYLSWSDLQSLNTIVESLSFFYIIKRVANNKILVKSKGLIHTMALCVFGTYLISDFVLVRTFPYYLNFLTSMHPLIACVLWQLMIFTVCMVVVYLARIIPVIRRYI